MPEWVLRGAWRHPTKGLVHHLCGADVYQTSHCIEPDVLHRAHAARGVQQDPGERPGAPALPCPALPCPALPCPVI